MEAHAITTRLGALLVEDTTNVDSARQKACFAKPTSAT